MDWKKELKETNWISLFFTIGMFVLVLRAISLKSILQPLPIDIQYITTIIMLYLLAKSAFKKMGE